MSTPHPATSLPYRQLVYRSLASPTLTGGDIAQILYSSRTLNATRGISGLLLHGTGEFMQVLEGPPEAVGALYATIAQDPRHSQAKVLLDVRVRDRLFECWLMGFRDLADYYTNATSEGWLDCVQDDEGHVVDCDFLEGVVVEDSGCVKLLAAFVAERREKNPAPTTATEPSPHASNNESWPRPSLNSGI
ncbi:Acylphosphatase-like domain-containing protein [Powellomyces hirtus]|nr:Acylphosphatase-like domain-containing protein [Powellomyces hirtus]